jgi:DNA-binding GntR family transcriptional regulator
MCPKVVATRVGWWFDIPPALWNNHVMSDVIGPTKLSDQIAATLRAEIVGGLHRDPGSLRLVSLAERLGVSTTPVREALAILERQGLVSGHIHRGFQVADLTPTDVGDVYEMHAFIMRTLTARAAQRMSETDVDQLEAMEVTLWKAVRSKDVVLARETNHGIHARINDASGSALLLRFLRASAPFVNIVSDIREIEKPRPETSGHTAIFNAIRSRDSELAADLMHEHVMQNGRAAVAQTRNRAAAALKEAAKAARAIS